MPKRTTTLELMLPPRSREQPAHRWLCSAMRSEILEGRLRPGSRLPATRDLARQYGLSRGTIVGAFEQLKAEGYLTATSGSGTFVNDVLPDELLNVASSPAAAAGATAHAPRRLSTLGKRVVEFPGYDPGRIRAFRSNLPALDLFPTTLWAQLISRRVRRATTRDLMGTAAMGWMPLREAIAGYLATSRGVKCDAGQVAIVSGIQEAFSLAARLFVEPGDRVCIEDPGYPGARLVLESIGAKIVGTRADDEGMVLHRRMHGARFVYTTPAHQFPLGIAMSLPRRLELLEWARGQNAMIFEDDYDSEYRYSGRPIPALQGLDRHGQVLFAGSFSKVLFPSIRLGYLVVPADLTERFSALISITKLQAPLLDQAVLGEFITAGHFGRHIRRMREIYAARLGVLIDSARKRLGGLLEISPVEAGLQTVGWLAGGIDAAAAAAKAAEHNVAVTALTRYAHAPMKRQGLHLGFAAIDAREIRRGVDALAIALEELT